MYYSSAPKYVGHINHWSIIFSHHRRRRRRSKRVAGERGVLHCCCDKQERSEQHPGGSTYCCASVLSLPLTVFPALAVSVCCCQQRKEEENGGRIGSLHGWLFQNAKKTAPLHYTAPVPGIRTRRHLQHQHHQLPENPTHQR